MIITEEIWSDAKNIFGICLEEKLFRLLTDSIQLLVTAGQWDAVTGAVDLCVDNSSCVTLPREVEQVLAVNICGCPARGLDRLFEFHLNGSGSNSCSCRYSWMDQAEFPTYRDLKCPSRLVAFLDNEEDTGKKLRVYGWDIENRPLQTKISEGVWEQGILIPTIFSYALPASTDPIVSRISHIVKEVTVGNIRLSSFDSSSSTGTLLGIYEPDETVPMYRRIKISPCSSWVRVLYRKRTYEIRSIRDRILLSSRPALLLAMRATKYYMDGDLQNAVAFESQAVRLLNQKEWTLASPAGMPVQIVDINSDYTHSDYLD